MAKERITFDGRMSLPVSSGGKQRDLYPLVVKLTHRVWGWSPPGSASFEDAVSEGVIAVLSASRRFDEKKAKLITLAYRRIIGSTQDLVKAELRYAKRFIPTDPSLIPQGRDYGFEARTSNELLFARVMSEIDRVLPFEEALLVRRYYLEEKPDAAIAEELGISTYHVSRRRRASIEIVRSCFPATSSIFIA